MELGNNQLYRRLEIHKRPPSPCKYANYKKNCIPGYTSYTMSGIIKTLNNKILTLYYIKYNIITQLKTFFYPICEADYGRITGGGVWGAPTTRPMKTLPVTFRAMPMGRNVPREKEPGQLAPS
jgi:hypothetical protein